MNAEAFIAECNAEAMNKTQEIEKKQCWLVNENISPCPACIHHDDSSTYAGGTLSCGTKKITWPIFFLQSSPFKRSTNREIRIISENRRQDISKVTQRFLKFVCSQISKGQNKNLWFAKNYHLIALSTCPMSVSFKSVLLGSRFCVTTNFLMSKSLFSIMITENWLWLGNQYQEARVQNSRKLDTWTG